AIKSCISNRRIEMTGLNRGNPCVRWQPGDVFDHVCPMSPVVARNLNVAIVRSGPDYIAILGRLVNRIDGLVLLGVGIVDGQPARQFLMLASRIVGGEIRRDAIPGFAVVARTKQELPAEIDCSWVVGTHVDRRIPVKAKVRLSSPR